MDAQMRERADQILRERFAVMFAVSQSGIPAGQKLGS
jgi:hypothetical protein